MLGRIKYSPAASKKLDAESKNADHKIDKIFLSIYGHGWSGHRVKQLGKWMGSYINEFGSGSFRSIVSWM